jgi:transcriptional regulator GlxA family with amidase domain
MDAHLDERLDLAALARRAHFSRFHFLRVFRNRYHETPHQYLTRRRLARARELLANTRLTVTEICFAVGFESPGSFSTLFRRSTGYSPSVYRAQAQEARRNPFRFIPACYRHKYGLTYEPLEESNFR